MMTQTENAAAAAAPAVGQAAPEFELHGDDGKLHRLSEFRGRTVVLYFYPKDNTPGCTQESCDFRDHSAAYADKNAVILGISPDSVASHQKFKAKFSLPFLLLADPGAVVAARYGAWGEKNMYGKKSMGLIRSTFVIGGDGRLTAVYRKVSVTGHVDKVLAGLSA
jgi:peroxiredoxin Q/BCP